MLQSLSCEGGGKRMVVVEFGCFSTCKGHALVAKFRAKVKGTDFTMQEVLYSFEWIKSVDSQ